MRTLTLRNRFQGNSTIVENEFIDIYMAKANGEYVKVYLLLLRHLNAHNTSLTISKLADCLDCTEKDIMRALNHWSEVGLLKIEYDETGNICALSIGKTSETASVPQKPPVVGTCGAIMQNVAASQPANVSSETRQHSQNEQEQLRQLYFVAEQYLGKPLSHTDVQRINYFFDSLRFSVDLIEYLIEYCVENGHKSMHYIESVARAWADKNITTVSEAKSDSMIYNRTCFTILNTFGIKGRSPAEIELNYIKKWTEEYGFSLDIIVEACSRTIANTHQPDFKYTDKILKNWLAKDVHNLSDISRLDLEYQKEKAVKKQTSQRLPSAPANRFNNFTGRSYDISSLEQQLLHTQ